MDCSFVVGRSDRLGFGGGWVEGCFWRGFRADRRQQSGLGVRDRFGVEVAFGVGASPRLVVRVMHLWVISSRLRDSLAAVIVEQFASMASASFISTRVTDETKHRFAAVARQQGISESALLKRLVDMSLLAVAEAPANVPEPSERVASDGRLSMRLREDDLILLRDRATARGYPTSTYASLLIRGHLRSLTPLPTAELAAMKRAVAELSAIGRNLNQIARVVNQGERPAGPSKADLQALLRACVGLRDHVRGLINANLESWRTGYEKATH